VHINIRDATQGPTVARRDPEKKRKDSKLTISSPFSTPVSTLGTLRWVISSSCSIWSSRRICNVCLVLNLRWRKRADVLADDRVIKATILGDDNFEI